MVEASMPACTGFVCAEVRLLGLAGRIAGVLSGGVEREKGEEAMAAESSFDIVSEFDRQELVNALDQTLREVRTRYDLKDSGATVELEKHELHFRAPALMTLNAVRDILQSKMVARKLSLKILKFDEPEEASGGSVRQLATLQQGLSQDLARQISKLLRDNFPKVKSQIQGDAIRVTSKSKDELQAVQAALREKDYPVPLQFTNYR